MRGLASRTWSRLLGLGGIHAQIGLELGEDLEDPLELRARLGCMTHGSELAGTLREGVSISHRK